MEVSIVMGTPPVSIHFRLGLSHGSSHEINHPAPPGSKAQHQRWPGDAEPPRLLTETPKPQGPAVQLGGYRLSIILSLFGDTPPLANKLGNYKNQGLT